MKGTPNTYQARAANSNYMYSLDRRRADKAIKVKVFETPILLGEGKIYLMEAGVAGIKVIEVAGFEFDGLKSAKIFNLESDRIQRWQW
jgi:hypothetical protein